MKSEAQIATIGQPLSVANPIFSRMNKEAEIPEDLAVRLEEWASAHGMTFDTALELAVLIRWEQSRSSSESPATELSVLPPHSPSA
jgi:hypothetical protein